MLQESWRCMYSVNHWVRVCYWDTETLSSKLHHILGQNCLFSIPYPKLNCLKTIPFTEGHTYRAYVGE